MTDELRERLARLDPMPTGVTVEAAASESSRELLEEVMSIELDEKNEGAASRSGGVRWLSIAAVVALLVGVGAVLATTLGGGEPTQMELAAGGEDSTMTCIMFSTEQLATAQVAFEGTVVSSEGPVVTLDVDTWYTGGDTDQVVLNAPQGMEALIGGMEFEVGGTYLISAYDGNVNYCGFSGPSTPEFKAAFEEAFGA